MQARFIDSINQLSAAEWDGLWASDYPFIQYHFLQALELGKCTTKDSGWQPHHLIVYDNDCPVAALPLYLKTHSYGEYVFDWAWADAYHRCGLTYYPKLLSAIPFTPATGPRIAIAAEQDRKTLTNFIIDSVQQEAQRLGASSWHYLFPAEDHHLPTRQVLPANQMMPRLGCQFHWFNQNYGSFDDFLSHFNSRKRKSVKRERRQVIEQGVTLERLCGHEITPEHWRQFYTFYHATYLKRSGGSGYLSASFFKQLAQQPQQIMMVVATQAGNQAENIVATALYFFDQTTLYGRYWGTLDDIPGLHFEACYYQGIEFAIERKLQRFDPGAQGEHKIQRGFTPVFTHSYHWLADDRLRAAVEDFLQREAAGIKHYQKDCCNYLPFKDKS
jgi:predicted N-acyltransferase